MTIPKRDKRKRRIRREGTKALPAPVLDRMIGNRQCQYDLRFTDDVYCPICGRVTVIQK